MLASIWTKETLQYKEARSVLLDNKEQILSIINDFKLANSSIGNNFYILGSSSLILQNQMASYRIHDVDIYCDNITNITEVNGVDILKNDISPVGWKDRVVEIDGVKCASVFDVTCTMGLSFKKKPLRKIMLIWMLRDLNLEEVRQAMKEKLDSGIGVTESDFKHFELFEKQITQRMIDLNRHPQDELIELLKSEELKNKDKEDVS